MNNETLVAQIDTKTDIVSLYNYAKEIYYFVKGLPNSSVMEQKFLQEVFLVRVLIRLHDLALATPLPTPEQFVDWFKMQRLERNQETRVVRQGQVMNKWGRANDSVQNAWLLAARERIPGDGGWDEINNILESTKVTQAPFSVAFQRETL